MHCLQQGSKRREYEFCDTKNSGNKTTKRGYIPPKSFNVFQYDDGVTLSETENIRPSLVGLCVDYLTRYIMFGNITESFRISLCGAIVLDENEHTEHYSQKAKLLLDAIVGLDDNSITSACQLCGFDVAFRAGVKGYKPVENILPDNSTIENIRAMVIRSKHFFDDYGPIVLDGFTFQLNNK